MRFRSFFRTTLASGALLLFALLAGFFAFCATLPRAGSFVAEDVGAVPVAERGIIVLTGGSGERITTGLDLQRQGLADRVLITGVHPQTRKGDLAQMGDPDVLACCVDLGPYARTTKGNAIESREWLERNGYELVLLVTSDFHLPRATAELRNSVPDIDVVGVPVASELAPELGWMSSPSSWRLLATEYLKYLVVRIRSLA